MYKKNTYITGSWVFAACQSLRYMYENIIPNARSRSTISCVAFDFQSFKLINSDLNFSTTSIGTNFLEISKITGGVGSILVASLLL